MPPKILHIVPCVSTKIPVFVSYGYPINSIERLANETNQNISCFQTTIQKFGWRMEGKLFTKGTRIGKLPRIEVRERVTFTTAR